MQPIKSCLVLYIIQALIKTIKMKFLYLSFFCALCHGMTNAQESLPYIFSVDEAAYSPLENPTSLTFEQIWDDPAFTVSIPFDFHFLGDTITTLNTNDDLTGGLLFAGNGDQSGIDMILVYITDIIDLGYRTGTSESSINYEVVGDQPNRILKMEWDNVGFYEEVADTNFVIQSYLNLQAWFYEGSNDIEFRYGPNFIASPFFHDVGGISCGIAESLSFTSGRIDNLWMLIGNPNDPSIRKEVNFEFFAEDPPVMLSDPTEGTVYRFSSLVTSTNQIVTELNGVEVFPTVVKEYLVVENKNAEKLDYKITNILGHLVQEGKFQSDRIEIITSHLQSGPYFIVLNAGNKTTVERFIVSR